MKRLSYFIVSVLFAFAIVSCESDNSKKSDANGASETEKPDASDEMDKTDDAVDADMMAVPVAEGDTSSVNEMESSGTMEGSKGETLGIEGVDHPPLFPDCKGVTGKEAQNDCFADELSKYIVDKFKYPELAKSTGTEGTIFVSFVVSLNGDVVNPVVVREADMTSNVMGTEADEAYNSLKEYSVELISGLPDIDPAEVNGSPVNFQYVVPISYKLQ